MVSGWGLVLGWVWEWNVGERDGRTLLAVVADRGGGGGFYDEDWSWTISMDPGTETNLHTGGLAHLTCTSCLSCQRLHSC